MIRGLYTSSAGMQVEQMRQEAIANNLANLNTSGFKRDMALLEARENKRLMRTNDPMGKEGLGPTQRRVIGELGTGVLVDRVIKRFEQGTLQQTENPFDLALQGEGFFTVQDGNGQRLYTRSGDFTRDGQGRLVDKAGRAVMGGHGPVGVPNGKLAVGLDGLVSVDGRAVDRLAIVRFDDPETTLEKVGDTSFRPLDDQAGLPAAAEVHQGMIEQANVNSVREMVEMIAALRHYEANQKAVFSQDETLEKAVNQVGKV